MIEPGAQQHGVPEVAHHEQVRGQVHAGDVEEDRAEDLVGECPPVELGHQTGDVVAVGDVAAGDVAAHRGGAHDAIPITRTLPRMGSVTTLSASSAT